MLIMRIVKLVRFFFFSFEVCKGFVVGSVDEEQFGEFYFVFLEFDEWVGELFDNIYWNFSCIYVLGYFFCFFFSYVCVFDVVEEGGVVDEDVVGYEVVGFSCDIIDVIFVFEFFYVFNWNEYEVFSEVFDVVNVI